MGTVSLSTQFHNSSQRKDFNLTKKSSIGSCKTGVGEESMSTYEKSKSLVRILRFELFLQQGLAPGWDGMADYINRD